jgi:hypothetical protein
VFLLFSRGSHAAALEAQSSITPTTGMNENPLEQAPSLAGRLISTRLDLLLLLFTINTLYFLITFLIQYYIL